MNGNATSAAGRQPTGRSLPVAVAPERLLALSNRRLHLILLPTEACNFRCHYCYETFRYKRMERWVVDGVKRWISRRVSGLDELALSWFGGEPLLARDLIEEVMAHVCREQSQRAGLRVSADMTTNGYLLSPAVARGLVDLGVDDYQVSLDGPRDFHDRKRVMPGGKGTFDRIWSHLRNLHASEIPFRIVLRIHVDRENARALPSLLEAVAENFGGDDRFEVFIRTLSRLGGPHDASLPIFEREEGQRTVALLRDRARDLGLAQLDTRPQREICYAAHGNSFVVRANGRINKCTVAMEAPQNQIGAIRPDGTVQIESQSLRPWLRGLASGDPDALRCPMVGLAERKEESLR